MSFSSRVSRALDENWSINRFSKKFWILCTTKFLFILHNDIFSWRREKLGIPLSLPENMIILYYNRRTERFRLYKKNEITIKMLSAICEVLKCPVPPYTTHKIYIESIDRPDLTKFEKSPEGYIYYQKRKCGENCVVYNGKYYFIEMINSLYPNRNVHYKVLNLSGLGIQAISEIEGLETLQLLGKLNLQDNKITEIKGLGIHESLFNLDLGNNKLSEIKGLESFKRLRILNLNNNLIKEIKGLENININGHVEINLGGNPIPHRILRRIGRLNEEGDANNPKKIVDFCIRNKRKAEKINKSLFTKLKKIIMVSNRFRLDMLKDILDIDKKTLIRIIEKWSVGFGLRIDGNYLIIEKDVAQEFMDALDKQFNEWERI